MVGNKENLEQHDCKINFLGFKNNANDLINVYDDHNIIILLN